MAYQGNFPIEAKLKTFLALDPALFIDGRRIAGDASARLPVYDPATGLELTQIIDADASDVDRAVRSAHAAFEDGRWRNLRPTDRERILLRLAELIDENAEALAQLETLDQGKSIHMSRIFASGASAQWTRYIAGLTTKITGRTMELSLPPSPANWTAYTRREPIGVVAGIAPWNFPMMIALWKVIPALAAGCSIVLKPSEVTPLAGLWLAELATEAGIPDGVFNVVTGVGSVSGSALVSHPLVRKITFTGSTATGKAIGRVAMDNLVPVSLELGGKNPALVLKDVDVEAVASGLVIAGFFNQGQVCAAASRLYVEAPVYDAVVGALEAAIKGMSIGAGLDPTTQVNPLVSKAHQDKVSRYVADARAKGADILEGVAAPDSEGYYVSPSLILNPSNDMDLARQEVFGPVVNVTKIDSVEEGIALANDIELGLTASVWTQNLSQAMNITRCLDAGTVWVNSHNFIDPNMPFGGMKQSGLGRDFGVDWLDAFTEVKSVCISH